MAQWEQAGLASQRKVVQVGLGAKCVCWWKCEIGLLGSCRVTYSIIFLIHKIK